ncbi:MULTISPECIES: DsrH/TusB family sulfur metabolism protein [unclassified Acinetobacter]|uniref:DsrH/TusB family sulfur metabolism protein n=1 Tax=unclassified Acinetobacter TaxID=196816 RepID=UPI000DA69BE4|nr:MULTISPECIES: DsrH/TusB family sulfur metabolism protein [unclassified Acinetobacter]
MSKTLYLVQSPFAATELALSKLQNLYQSGDDVVLMGDAVLYIQHPFIQQLACVFVLEQDAENIAAAYPSNLETISYARFAELCLNHSRCISLK